MNSFRRAAEDVLERSGRSMHLNDIWKAIEIGGLRTPTGKTPPASLRTEIIRHTIHKDLSLSFKEKVFFQTGPNTFGLTKWLNGYFPEWLCTGSGKQTKNLRKINEIPITTIEGSRIARWHWEIERNAKIITIAKERALKKDKSLRCAICNFSFLETYGQAGKGFIEGHHRFPVHMGVRRTVLDDIILVCSNCHSMLHRTKTMSIEKLKKQLSQV